MRACEYKMGTKDYVDIDKEIVSVESLTDDQIIDAVTNNDESSDDDSKQLILNDQQTFQYPQNKRNSTCRWCMHA